LSYIERKCKKGNYYKFIVRDYKIIDGKKVTIAVSKTIHVVTNGGKNGNAKSVTVNKSKVSLKKGKTFQIKAKEIKQKKKLRYHRKVCYESSNPNVASVTKNGIIKAKKKGKCTIYVYAQSGIYKKVKVIVK
nr:Ig-like domain-containing protein [Lachnospiraceae bacterium]